MKKVLYQWQEECLERWFANHGRGMVQAVTGSGKTLLALTAAERLEKQLNQELRVKIVVPTGALMRQWNQALRNFLAESGGNKRQPADIQREIGLRGAGYKASSNRKYMIYVINSARYELARQILSELRSGAAVLLIADECHRYESDQNRLIFEFLPYIQPYETRFFSLGLSATLPHGQSQSYLASVLGRKIYSYGMTKAAAMHTVCKYDIFHISLSFQHTESDEYQEITDWMGTLYRRLLQMDPFLRDMNQKELFDMLTVLAGGQNRKLAETASLYIKLSYKRRTLICLASARIACACALIERLQLSEKIIIFGERISQAEELYQLLQKQYPEKVGRCHSKIGPLANKNTLNRFRDGEIRILIACKSMDEGIDIPDAAVGIILSGTSVQRQRIQRLGRVIRKKEKKDRASLYYLHLKDTIEDRCFLPNSGEDHLFELEYLSDTREFKNPLYDRAAAKLLAEMKSKGASADKLSEARRCLRLGCIRSDWMSGYGNISNKIKSARHTEDKNYWICMKKIAELLS
ncbi:MAG: DEAD/DEAH box helicase [Eubacteriales bacterium]|nr:DEAD/DEAH box helicase [Eubacteriales bacterium]